jgi:hypothetical protein
MASILAVLVGALLLVLGGWVLLLRSEGFVEFLWPRTVTIGQVTIDGNESKPHAELLRARFDHHFRHPAAIASHTGFLEVATLDAPELFQQKGLEGGGADITVEVSGVNVTKLMRFANELARPAQWLVEGDFQNRSDRALLALRLRRGPRVIRTWYLERVKGPSEVQPRLLEQLTDDAIFQLVYDFWNAPDGDRDLAKWKEVIARPQAVQYLDPGTKRGDVPFPSAAAVASYYGAQGALGRYYAQGDWKDLDAALEGLRSLRVQMPEFVDGLQLLGIALAEKGEQGEAIHVYEHLDSMLEKRASDEVPSRRHTVALLKATAKAKLFTWQSAHEAVKELELLAEQLEGECKRAPVTQDGRGKAGCHELLAHCKVQLAHTYAFYLEYLTDHTITEVFKDKGSWMELSAKDLADLAPDSKDPAPVVARKVTLIANRHRAWVRSADEERRTVEQLWDQTKLADAQRRQSELRSRLFLAAGYGSYRMAQWERSERDGGAKVFEELAELKGGWGAKNVEPPPSSEAIGPLAKASFEALLSDAKHQLRRADANHPNHYAVLQQLGQVFSDPRDEKADLSVAEQYFGRAIRANPFDSRGHELLATILLRRVGRRGIEWGARDTIKAGLDEAAEAIRLNDVSYTAHLRHAEFQAMLLVLETNPENRRALQQQLEQFGKQARRFAPTVFRQRNPELTWLEVVSDARRLGEEAEALKGDAGEKARRLAAARDALLRKIADDLIENCKWWEEHWGQQQRVAEITSLHQRALELQQGIAKYPLTLENWDRIPIPFF